MLPTCVESTSNWHVPSAEQTGRAFLQMLGGEQLSVPPQFPAPSHLSDEVQALLSSQASVEGLGA
jgi:hypothetical protein